MTPTRDAPLRVLLVDDQHLVRTGFGRIFRDEPGLDVIGEAENGAEAVRMTAELAPDVVLMDIQMPVMNGVDATRAIRALEVERGLAATPILALSANVMRHQVEEYLAAGMNGFVAKPIEIAVLVDAIERVVAERDTVRRAAA